MDERERVKLARHRMERAEDMLFAAQRELEAIDYCTANNRAYYCMFHAIRAMLAIDGEECRKYAGVIAKFDENYVKPGAFKDEFSQLFRYASRVRDKSDYEDYYEYSEAETKELIWNAERLLNAVHVFMETQRGALWHSKA